MSTSFADTPVRSRSPTAHLLAARDTRTVQSLDALTADIFESDEEPVDFLVLTYAERHRDLPWLPAVHPTILDNNIATQLHRRNLARSPATLLISHEPLIT